MCERKWNNRAVEHAYKCMGGWMVYNCFDTFTMLYFGGNINETIAFKVKKLKSDNDF